MHKHLFHYIAMFIILSGGFSLLYFSFFWYSKNNLSMSFGMLIMGLIALSNFYLHWIKMKK
jgi:hypothetical protein